MGFTDLLSNVPTGTGAALTRATSGAGGFLSGLGGILGGGITLLQRGEVADEARRQEQLVAGREFELEKLRILRPESVAPPTAGAAPTFQISIPRAGLASSLPGLPAGLSPVLFFGGLALLVVALGMRRRRR